MKIAEFKHKKLSIELNANKLSDVYLDSAGNPIFHSDIEYWIKREANYILNGKQEIKPCYSINLTAFSKSQLNQRNKIADNWVNNQVKKIGIAETGGIITMLKSKGFEY